MNNYGEYTPDDLRLVADLDARAGEPCGKALRWAAAEIEHMRAYIEQLLSTLREAPTWKDRPFAVAVELREAQAELDRLRQAQENR